MAYNFKNALVNLNEEIRKSGGGGGGGGGDLPAIKIAVSQLQVSMTTVEGEVDRIKSVLNTITGFDDEEHEVGTWIDGSNIYEKTIYIATITKSTTWNNVAHGISNLGRVIDISGSFLASDSGRFYNVNVSRPNENNGIIFGCDETNLLYMNSWLADACDAYITIKYTKVSV